MIQAHHGAHIFPDRSARRCEDGVRFEAAELWGESAAGREAVYVDLWEDYLELV